MSKSSLSHPNSGVQDWKFKSGAVKIVGKVASLRLTMFGFTLLGLAMVISLNQHSAASALTIGSLTLLSINLAASLTTNPAFRLRPSLFGFHLGLLFLIVSLLAGHLTRFRGHLEISEGQQFDPKMIKEDRAAYFPPPLPTRGIFKQGAVKVKYAASLVRRETTSQVNLADGTSTVAGDALPLVIDQFRFYVTHNKGFAAQILWIDKEPKTTRTGNIHFPSFPRLASEQTAQWQAPDGSELSLQLTPRSYPQDQAWLLDSRWAGESLTVKLHRSNEYILQPGQSIELDGGTLQFRGFTFWLGYRIYYDPSLFWVFASALTALVFLAHSIWSKQRYIPVRAKPTTSLHREILE